jgi:hypothetical protein
MAIKTLNIFMHALIRERGLTRLTAYMMRGVLDVSPNKLLAMPSKAFGQLFTS